MKNSKTKLTPSNDRITKRNGAKVPVGITDEIAYAPPEVALSKRTPSELLGMTFDPNDHLFDNGMLIKGHLLAFLGQPGVGKSRLLIQLLVCLITGREFLGWKPCDLAPKCLVIQAENSNRRLQTDLMHLRVWIGEDLWELVEQNLVFHTIEEIHDGYLNVDDRAITQRIAALIKEEQAGVVVFDPLASFAAGNLNTDSGMTKTCRKLIELARFGDPHAAVIVLHHTLTGKQGMAKATGYDSASFGRGSKALVGIARAQINIAPAHPHDATKLVMACGKNNDGERFAPFGVKLNPKTMIHERDEEFDHDEWKSEIDGSTVHHKFTKEQVVALVKDLPLSKKDLVNAIMDESGCKKSTAYTAVQLADGKTIRRNANRDYEVIPASAQ